ncbi:MAG TPA: hypothetical protein VKE74_35280, partial [Gemmataceae bacterium]|nr:hypothetical protein [Gemmataceae bacterium]
MRVLMVNHPGTLKFRGGDLTQMRKTAEALRPLGVTVVESFDPEPDARGFDLAHVFNLRTVHTTPKQVKAIKQAGVPVVLSPIYLNVSLTLWANRVVPNIFSRPRPAEEIERLLGQLRERTLKVKGTKGETWTALGENRPDADYDHYQREVLRQVDHLVPNSYLEMDRLVKTLRVCDIPFTVVPYACDPAVFADADPEPFRKKHRTGPFVLQVGRIEASKNQIMLAYALRELDLPLVLIGGCQQPKYEECV